MSTTPYRPDIDGLRAMAILAVLAFHGWPAAVPGGFVGVDVFFVISGFLITRIILAPGFAFLDFYCRRARRLLPALLIVLATTLALGSAILPPDGFRRLLDHAIGGGLFGANFISYHDAGYFGGDADLRPLLHLWSLGVEEQFYLAWPLLILLARGTMAPRRFVAIVGAASFAAYLWLGEHDPRAAFFLPWARFWELLAGALMIGVEIPRRWAAATAFIGLSCVGAGIALASSEIEFPGLWLVLPVVGTCLLLASSTSPFNARLLASRLAVGIGLVSYPLYLWHWPLLSLLRNIDRAAGSSAIWATLATSMVLAVITWRLVERPLVRLPVRRVAAGLAAGLGALLIATTATEAAVPDEPNVLVNAACMQRYPYKPAGLWFCTLSQDRPPTVLLLGDSHAHHLYQGMVKALPADTILSIGSCAPTVGLRSGERGDKGDECAAERAYVDEEVLRTVPRLRWVVMAGMWRTFDAAGNEIDYWSGKRVSTFGPVTTSALDTYVGAIEKQLVRLGDVPVTLVLDTPRRGLAVEAQWQRQEPLRSRLRSLAATHPNLRVFDALSILCGEAWCRWNRLRDANHLSVAGSDEIAAGIVRQGSPL